MFGKNKKEASRLDLQALRRTADTARQDKATRGAAQSELAAGQSLAVAERAVKRIVRTLPDRITTAAREGKTELTVYTVGFDDPDETALVLVQETEKMGLRPELRHHPHPNWHGSCEVVVHW